MSQQGRCFVNCDRATRVRRSNSATLYFWYHPPVKRLLRISVRLYKETCEHGG